MVYAGWLRDDLPARMGGRRWRTLLQHSCGAPVAGRLCGPLRLARRLALVHFVLCGGGAGHVLLLARSLPVASKRRHRRPGHLEMCKRCAAYEPYIFHVGSRRAERDLARRVRRLLRGDGLRWQRKGLVHPRLHFVSEVCVRAEPRRGEPAEHSCSLGGLGLRGCGAPLRARTDGRGDTVAGVAAWISLRDTLRFRTSGPRADVLLRYAREPTVPRLEDDIGVRFFTARTVAAARDCGVAA